MAKKIDVIKCGECGNDTFSMKHVAPADEVRFGGSDEFRGHVVVVCSKCKSRSTIRPGPAVMVQTGTICGGWHK